MKTVIPTILHQKTNQCSLVLLGFHNHESIRFSLSTNFSNSLEIKIAALNDSMLLGVASQNVIYILYKHFAIVVFDPFEQISVGAHKPRIICSYIAVPIFV